MNDSVRMITLHKHEVDGIVWQIEINGVRTTTGITQDLMDVISQEGHRDKTIDGIVNELTESLLINSYPITIEEKERLNKLLQCMT